MELIFLSVSCMAAMELDPPHTSFLLILNNIREALEKSHSRGTCNWCCCGMVPALLDHQAPALHHVAPLPSRPAKDACCCQICLPSSHRHCTFQQECSALFTQYVCQLFFLPEEAQSQAKLQNSWLLLDFPASLLNTLSQTLSSVPLQYIHAVFLTPYENQFSGKDRRATHSIE